jgi:hypothetical protein
MKERMKTNKVTVILLAMTAALWGAGEAASANSESTVKATASQNPGVRQIADGGFAIRGSPVAEGELLNDAGQPIPDTAYQMTFSLYTASSGGPAFWVETLPVWTRAGRFVVPLGSISPIPETLRTGGSFLGIRVGAEPELPRLRNALSAYGWVPVVVGAIILFILMYLCFFKKWWTREDEIQLKRVKGDAVLRMKVEDNVQKGYRLLIEGADRRRSTSKTQWLLWTVAVVFSYIALWAARAFWGNLAPSTYLPANLLVSMGLSIGTMTAAKGITSGQVAKGLVQKPEADNRKEDQKKGGLFFDDDGVLDLSKIQMMLWTIIAIGVFVLRVVHQIQVGDSKLPDIDTSLMVLMGLGQGAYLTKKLTTTDTVRLTGLKSGTASPGGEVTIYGQSLGGSGRGGMVTIDGNPIPLTGEPPTSNEEWTDDHVTFCLPKEYPVGHHWDPKGELVQVGVVVSGSVGANTLPLTVFRRSQAERPIEEDTIEE